MSTQKQNEDVKNSNARIAIGDLNANADVRGGAGTVAPKPRKGSLPITTDPSVPVYDDSNGKEVLGT